MPCAASSVTTAHAGVGRRRRSGACRGSGRRAGCPRPAGRGRRALRAATSARGLPTAPALSRPLRSSMPGVVERGVQQRLHLRPLVGRALADDLTGGAVDEHEERRDGHVVGVPRRARHHRRDRGRGARRRMLATLSSPASLLTQHEPRVARDLERSAVAEHVPEREARAAAARQEREQREVLGADDRDAHRVVLGRGADDVDRASVTVASAPRADRTDRRADRGGDGVVGVARDRGRRRARAAPAGSRRGCAAARRRAAPAARARPRAA